MSDDWNIKKFGIDCWETGNPDIMWKTYHEKYIQKLREKLIDDIKELYYSKYKKLQKDSPVDKELQNLIKNINKRFGVDEDI